MSNKLPASHVVLEEVDYKGMLHQTVRDAGGAEYQRVVHTDEMYVPPDYAPTATYHEMLHHILAHGRVRPDRTGTGTTGVFGYQCRFDLSAGWFPLLTTKAMGGADWNNIVVELLWFLRGDTNIRWLLQHNVHIWTDWPLKHYNAAMAAVNEPQLTRAEFEARILAEPDFATEWGDCGPIYGAQWRAWRGLVVSAQPEFTHSTADHVCGHVHVDQQRIDQIQEVLNELGANPFGRRHIVSGWNPADIPAMTKSGLPPCHTLFQFNVRAMTIDERTIALMHKVEHFELEDLVPGLSEKDPLEGRALLHAAFDANDIPRYYLDCQLYQRSADTFLGVPYNIASYSLLTMIMAQQLGYAPGEFVHTFGDLHIYSNHMDQVQELLSRNPYDHPAPRVVITPRASLDEYTVDDFKLCDYTSYPALRAPIAV